MKEKLVKIIDDYCNNCYIPKNECSCYDDIMQSKYFEEQQEIFYYLNR